MYNDQATAITLMQSRIKESLLMAVLGYTCYNHISNNMPSVTGASGDSIYGEIYE